MKTQAERGTGEDGGCGRQKEPSQERQADRWRDTGRLVGHHGSRTLSPGLGVCAPSPGPSPAI